MTTARITVAATDPAGKVLVTGHADGTVTRWTLPRDGAARGHGHPAPVVACAVSPDGRLVVTGDADGHVRVAALNGDAVAGPISVEGPIACCRWLPDGSGVLVAGRAGLNLVSVRVSSST